MAEMQVYEGTAEEIAKLLQTGAFGGSRLKVIVDPAPAAEFAPESDSGDLQEEDFSDTLPDPPFTVRDRAHLEELLLAGINSPTRRVTEETWEETRREVYRRHLAREQSKQL